MFSANRHQCAGHPIAYTPSLASEDTVSPMADGVLPTDGGADDALKSARHENDIQEDTVWWYALTGDVHCDELAGLLTRDLTETY